MASSASARAASARGPALQAPVLVLVQRRAAAGAGRRPRIGRLGGAHHPSSARRRSDPSSSASSWGGRTWVASSRVSSPSVVSSPNGAGLVGALVGSRRRGRVGLVGGGRELRAGRHELGGDAVADLGDGLGPVEREAAGRAEARVAAVQGAAARARGDARLAQLGDVAAVVEHALERAQLAVDVVERGDLRVDEVGAVALEAVEVEDEAAEVAEAELAGPAQVAQAPPQPAAGAEARGGAGRRLARIDVALGGRRGVLAALLVVGGLELRLVVGVGVAPAEDALQDAGHVGRARSRRWPPSGRGRLSAGSGCIHGVERARRCGVAGLWLSRHRHDTPSSGSVAPFGGASAHHLKTTWRSMSMLVRMMRREDGQGTVEYVGIMLLLATVLTAVVAAASGKDFDLAATIVNEVKQAISGVGGKSPASPGSGGAV